MGGEGRNRVAVAKTTNAAAHYRAGSRNRRCSLCMMFRPPTGCTAIVGPVSKDGVCDYFERKDESDSHRWYGKNKKE